MGNQSSNLPAKNFVIFAKICCHSVGILLPKAQRSLQDDTGKIAIYLQPYAALCIIQVRINSLILGDIRRCKIQKLLPLTD